MEGLANNIDYQIPNERTKVQNLLDSVYDCQNPKFFSAVSAISDIGRGMSADFEKADVLLLPTDPVAKKSNKRKNVVTSKVTGNQSVVGTSVVSLRWHSNEEYGTLNPEQRS